MATKPKVPVAPEVETPVAPEVWLRTERYTYTDPETGVRFSRNPVKYTAAIKEGSWLGCQIEAGLIKKA